MAALIKAAGIPDGPHASPKVLRHRFGVTAVSKGIALNMVQKWLGHRFANYLAQLFARYLA
jgi:integrase/recombinase XerD